AAGVEKTSKKARHRLENALGSGLAAEKFERVIEAQGGNPKVVEDASVLPQAQEVEVYNAPRTGVVQRVDPKIIGRAVVAMGGGRLAVDDAVDPTVGFVITVKPGDKIPGGEPIASVFAKDPAGITLGFEALQQAIAIGDKLTEKPLPLISHRWTKAAVAVRESLHVGVPLLFFVGVELFLALGDAVQRRLRDVDVPRIDQELHFLVEEREEQGADVRAVHVGVRHDDDLVIARVVDLE